MFHVISNVQQLSLMWQTIKPTVPKPRWWRGAFLEHYNGSIRLDEGFTGEPKV